MPQEEAEVADAVGDEGFFGGGGGAGLEAVVVDQQVGAEADQLPENEHHEKIVGEDDAEHGEHEDREAAEVAGLGLVVVHVAEREHVHAEADHADDAEHEGGEVVELEAERELKGIELEPNGGGIKARAGEREVEAADRDEGGGHGRDERGDVALATQRERDDRGRGERQQEDDLGELERVLEHRWRSGLEG